MSCYPLVSDCLSWCFLNCFVFVKIYFQRSVVNHVYFLYWIVIFVYAQRIFGGASSFAFNNYFG